ncbi:MAG: DUF5686 and carboxypeptidase-like regulatory domain-containing protein [Chitinophagaceae bacterium]
MAQEKVISGNVMDAQTEEPLPFSSIQFNGTSTGVNSDEKGNYQFKLLHWPADSLVVHVLGYESLVLPVDLSLDSQRINFVLNRTSYALNEFIIHAGINPALIILKKIIRKKPVNNDSRLDSYTYQVYNKLEVDLDHLNKQKLIQNRFLKPFGFVFNNIDSTTEVTPFLPIFLSEVLSNYYYQKSPLRSKEVIKAIRTSGLKELGLNKYLGSFYENINVYDNYIPVFQKEFVSPISDLATLFYHYHLVDTQYIDHRKCFHITFIPRRKGENTFIGDFWVNDTTFAIQKMNLQVAPSANLNFVSRVSLVQQYQPLNDSLWFLAKDKFVADFITAGKRSIGLIGRKTTDYNHIVVNDTAATNIFTTKRFPQTINVLSGANHHTESFWKDHRLEPLSKNEKGIYKMVDTLKKIPLFRHYSNLIQFGVTGYLPLGPIDFGPYYYLYTYNHHEKTRLELDLGTNTQFSKKLYLHGYLGYGLGDQAFKGEIGGLWLMNRTPRRYLNGWYKHDLDDGVVYYDEVGSNSLFATAVRKPDVPQKFLMLDEKKLEYYSEGNSGFSQDIELIHEQFLPFSPLPTAKFYQAGSAFQPLNNTELGLTLRYAYQEKFMDLSFRRISLGSDYPIVELKFGMGIKGLINSDYHYQKIQLTLSDHLNIPPFGRLYYNAFAGKIFGTLPYPLLEVHPGNEIYYYDPYAFNMMNRYEYLSDQYAGLILQHSLGGGLFHFIPGIRSLKWRQFWTAKGVIGTLSPSNRALNLNNDYPFKTLKGKPYLELGTGVENIFHFFRVDFIWRVAPGPQPGDSRSSRFGIFGSFQLEF